MVEINKKKYSQSEAKKLVEEISKDYEAKLEDLRCIITDFKEENKRLTNELALYNGKKEMLENALFRSEESVHEFEKSLQARYTLTIKKLQNFSNRWKDYFNSLREKYPSYPFVTDAVNIKQKLSELLLDNSMVKTINDLDELLKRNEEKYSSKIFNPKEKINEYIAATGDNGFNLDEVLNPGELKLEDLCRELGLTEEE